MAMNKKPVTAPALLDQGNDSDYADHGGTRLAYLQSLAEEHDTNLNDVIGLADLFGPTEDFDGLVCAIEDMEALREDFETKE
jgi:hypothetical protein